VSESLTLRHLRYFIAVSEELHFGRAAARLHMTQPALSQQIQQLERIAEVRLLERDNRRVELTPAGNTFAKQARRVLAGADRALELARRAGADTEPLRVGYSSTLQWYFVPQLIDRLAEWPDQPNIVWMSVPEEISNQDVLGRRFDLALVRQFERTEGLQHEVLLWERPAIYVSRDDPLASLETVPFAALAGYRVRSLFPEFAPLRHAALLHDLAVANVDLDLDPTLGFARGLTAREVAAGLYVGIGLSTIGPIFPGLAVVPLSSEASSVPLTLAWQSEDDRSGIARLVALARHVAQTGAFPEHVRRADGPGQSRSVPTPGGRPRS
jgi:DNA-binding transcriptional LysR family regulator